MAPMLEEIALSYRGCLSVVKLDVGLHPKTAARYRVRGLPAMLLFSQGVVIAQKVGGLSKKQLDEFLTVNLVPWEHSGNPG
jgi:thioredoxin 1